MGGWKKKMDKAKKLHRPSLDDWECDQLYKQFPAFVERIVCNEEEHFKSFFLPHTNYSRRSLPVVLDTYHLSCDEFFDKYEGTETPCVIQNIPLEEDWPAVHKWTFEALERSDNALLDRRFKCGEDDDGDNITVKLKYFLQYMHHNKDDSPLYIFDSSFEDDKTAQSILNDYRVPKYFRNDLFRYVSESRRPPYRWFLVGPERSGTCIHLDPLATNAWNTLIQGKKRWVLFPPHVPKRVVKGKGLIGKDEDDEAIHYFMFILPRIKQRAAERADHEEYRDFACYEFTQNEGETVFVPHGWWHAVLNLTDTVGITQNFVSPRNFDSCWKETRTGRKRMAYKWLCKLKEHERDLARRALEINKSDNFRMKYDPEEIKRREDMEHRQKLQKVV